MVWGNEMVLLQTQADGTQDSLYTVHLAFLYGHPQLILLTCKLKTILCYILENRIFSAC